MREDELRKGASETADQMASTPLEPSIQASERKSELQSCRQVEEEQGVRVRARRKV